MLIKSKVRLFVLLVILGIGQGCQQNVNDPAPDDGAYFPLQIGDYWVYQITDQVYPSATTSTRQVFQLQQKISRSYTQNGQVYFLVEESVRPTEQTAWKLNAIRTVYKSLSEVVGQESNQPVIKLVFPINSATSWNTNAYNARPDTLLQYRNSGRPFTVGKRLFNRTISVAGPTDSTLVSQQKYIRVYAQTIGLVYGEEASLAYCQSSPGCIGKGLIESGFLRTWELLASNRLP